MYSIRKYIPYPVINHNGKEYKKDCIFKKKNRNIYRYINTHLDGRADSEKKFFLKDLHVPVKT